MTREAMDQELLEYLYGCHEDPAALEARLAEDPELRARLEAVRATKGLLDEAAHSPVDLELVPPDAARSPRSPWRVLAAAARSHAAPKRDQVLLRRGRLNG